MKSKEAKMLFHGKDKLNCAQAVLRTFQAEFGISDQEIGSAANAGGGRAEGGACGALHASRILLNDPVIQQRVDRDFVIMERDQPPHPEHVVYICKKKDGTA